MNSRNRPTYPNFECVWRYCETGFGIDLGCGSKRLSPSILAVDQRDHGVGPNFPDLIGDVRDLGKLGFRPECFDFIFSSHVLEDFDDIAGVTRNWWTYIKQAGYLVLLLPDMEGGRYAKVGEEGGNPSHKTNVGVAYMTELTQRLFGSRAQIVQSGTIEEGFTFDFVVRKKGG